MIPSLMIPSLMIPSLRSQLPCATSERVRLCAHPEIAKKHHFTFVRPRSTVHAVFILYNAEQRWCMCTCMQERHWGRMHTTHMAHIMYDKKEILLVVCSHSSRAERVCKTKQFVWPGRQLEDTRSTPSATH